MWHLNLSGDCTEIRLISENGEMMTDEKNQLPIGPLIDLRSLTRDGIDYVIVSLLRVQCVFSDAMVSVLCYTKSVIFPYIILLNIPFGLVPMRT